jgi:hypothetical protein
MRKYREVVFIQDDTDSIIDKLYNVEGVIAHGATSESIAEAVEYLKQWDYSEGEVSDTLQAGSHDDVFEHDGYIMTANPGLGYVGLVAIVDASMSTNEALALYDDFLNETSEVINVCGYLFEPARALRELDPIGYRCGFHDWADSEGIDTDELSD